MDTAERSLLTATVDDALTAASARGHVDKVLAELGWLEMFEAEPDDAIAIVFGALGRANAVATALDDVLLAALGIAPNTETAVLLPSFGQWDAPSRLDGKRIEGQGLTTTRATTAGAVVTVCASGNDLCAVTVPTASVTVTPMRGIDPDGNWCRVEIAARAGSVATLDGANWDRAVALGRRAVASQMAGASRAMLELARQHALDRVQFGKPIASFQAVRHRLAEALVAIEALDAALAAAADTPGWETAALAKAVAGRTTRTVAVHCQQVLAGIGFTTDHPFHRYLKRVMLLEGLFGTSEAITLALGRELLANRSVRTLIEL